MSEPQDPGKVLDTLDPGDDVQLRFRYQHAYAAIQCAKMLYENSDIAAVICENHEDILLRRNTGKYIAVQVKTRNFTGKPFNCNEDVVIKAFRRFAKLEAEFSAWFDQYTFVTNHGFNDEPDDYANPKYFLGKLRERGSVSGLRKTNPLRAYVCEVCNGSNVAESAAIAALLKVALVGYESGLDHTYQDLTRVVGELPVCCGTTHKAVYDFADNLIFEVFTASSKKIGGSVGDLYNLVTDFDGHKKNLILLGKFLTKADIVKVANESLSPCGENLLVSHNLVSGTLVPPGMDVMQEKLLHGGLECERVKKLQDYKASVEVAYVRWVNKLGLAVANERIAHLKSFVEDDCIEARLSAGATVSGKAPQMYGELRQHLDDRVCQPQATLPMFGFGREHLLGVAAILTEECKVWWSEEFVPSSKRKGSS